MKNLLIFLFGAACGVGGTLLWLRKDIKKQLEMIENNGKNGDEMPFSVGETEAKTEVEDAEKDDSDMPIAVRKETRVAYHNIVNDVISGKKPNIGVPVMPRDDEIAEPENDFPGEFVGEDETDGGIFEIDRDQFDRDESYEKDRLVYFRGDKIMSTERGTIIQNPAILVGTMWENCVGNYVKNTAFIRNSKMVTDYEIYVEDGLYEDEYGLEDNYRED